MLSPFHEEVADQLRKVGNPRYGEAVRVDRGSAIEHLGVSFPDMRAAVKRGFSFYGESPEDVLRTWDGLWRESPYGEVLFAAIEYYRRWPKRWPDGLWPVVRGWIERVDNWCHADSLAALYSQVLERDPDAVYPHLQVWNAAEGEWQRRISMVSLIHYSGKNAVFLPLDKVLPLVSNCLADDRHYVQAAIGWVLREMGNAYPAEVQAYLADNAGSMSASALSRAIERLPAGEKAELRELRKRSAAGP